ncbi:hypothetical protein CANARDRAFT_21548 [[Candida] arabinofermentans NRRL YB-2248]|uniref:Uncharacterized protein n=1 Tax=[Candida] arabinofermentans NRRL YB-2248 TaxID=983967 RepID=A0A1E4T786_9ASCO|nr:hypothetical protein CANARDRAFT_21548 [[Candida] arabinofermentans NRRL YB-2248]
MHQVSNDTKNENNSFNFVSDDPYNGKKIEEISSKGRRRDHVKKEHKTKRKQHGRKNTLLDKEGLQEKDDESPSNNSVLDHDTKTAENEATPTREQRVKRSWYSGVGVHNNTKYSSTTGGLSIADHLHEFNIQDDEVTADDFKVKLQLSGAATAATTIPYIPFMSEYSTSPGFKREEEQVIVNESSFQPHKITLRYPLTPDTSRFKPLTEVASIGQSQTKSLKGNDDFELNQFNEFNDEELKFVNAVDNKLKQIFIENWFTRITVFCFLASCLTLIILNFMFFFNNYGLLLPEGFELIHLFFISLVLILIIFIIAGLGSREVKKSGRFVIVPFFIIFFKVLVWPDYQFIDDWFGDDKYEFLRFKLTQATGNY